MLSLHCHKMDQTWWAEGVEEVEKVEEVEESEEVVEEVEKVEAVEDSAEEVEESAHQNVCSLDNLNHEQNKVKSFTILAR
jgi:hypothetical protein